MTTSRDSCVFCRIADEKEKNKIYYQDEEFVVFDDIKPISKHHFLVVTKEHIKNAKILDHTHLELVKNMVEIGKKVLTEQGGDSSDIRFGFHWPPFNSINHLHLHVISPTNQIGFISNKLFSPDSFWFVTPDYILNRIKQTASSL